MLTYLGAACKAAREEAGVSQMAVVGALPPSKRGEGPRYPSILSRFENGQGWPERVDEIVRAYAAMTDREEISIWANAVTRWAEVLGSRTAERLAREASQAADALAGTRVRSRQPGRAKPR